MTLDTGQLPSFRLDGRRALITGGGRGLRFAAAGALAEAGAQVTLVARGRSEIEQAAASLASRGHVAAAAVLDVTDTDAMRGFVGANGPFDILVNNAGSNRPASLFDVTEADF